MSIGMSVGLGVCETTRPVATDANQVTLETYHAGSQVTVETYHNGSQVDVETYHA